MSLAAALLFGELYLLDSEFFINFQALTVGLYLGVPAPMSRSRYPLLWPLLPPWNIRCAIPGG